MAHTAKPYASVPTLFDKVQGELSAIEEITRVLGSLPDHETRLRVIKWIEERFANGFHGAEPLPSKPAVALAVPPPAPAPSDSGLSFPDDLFGPPVDAADAGDLAGVFDHTPVKPHGLDLHDVFDLPPEPVVDRGSEPQQPVAFAQHQHVFDLVPPTEGSPPGGEPAEPAAEQPARVADRNQLTLLLLADMSPPSVLKKLEPTPADEMRESPVNEPVAAPAPSHASTTRDAQPSTGPAPTVSAADAAPAIAQPLPRAPRAPGPQPPNAAAPQDSMEAMLRSLVDDFRQLADEWGNT